MKKLTLSSNALIRREHFGCLACNLLKGKFYPYNEGMIHLLRRLRTPISKSTLISSLRQEFRVDDSEVSSYLAELERNGIIVQSGSALDHFFFFDDVQSFRTDCLASPLAVTLYVTNWCPKKCKHCVVRSSPYWNRAGELETTQWFVVLEKLRAAGVARLVITGGDPLSRRDIFEILAYADRLKFFTLLLTDFDGMNQGHLDQLMALEHLGDLQVSLDGADEATHDWMRGEGAFQEAKKRMGLLHHNNIPFTISATIHRGNFHQVDQFADIVEKYGAGYLYLNPLAPYGRGEDLREYLLDDAQLWQLGQAYLRLIMERGINPGNNFWTDNLDKIGAEDFHPFANALDAFSIGVFTCTVNATGEVYLDSKYKSQERLSLGNILNREVSDIWNDPKLDPLRKHFSPDKFAYVDDSLLVE